MTRHHSRYAVNGRTGLLSWDGDTDKPLSVSFARSLCRGGGDIGICIVIGMHIGLLSVEGMVARKSMSFLVRLCACSLRFINYEGAVLWLSSGGFSQVVRHSREAGHKFGHRYPFWY